MTAALLACLRVLVLALASLALAAVVVLASEVKESADQDIHCDPAETWCP